jgi:hypothetical protein
MNLETRLEGTPRNRWQDQVREDGRIMGAEVWQEKIISHRGMEEAPENGKTHANGMN